MFLLRSRRPKRHAQETGKVGPQPPHEHELGDAPPACAPASSSSWVRTKQRGRTESGGMEGAPACVPAAGAPSSSVDLLPSDESRLIATETALRIYHAVIRAMAEERATDEIPAIARKAALLSPARLPPLPPKAPPPPPAAEDHGPVAPIHGAGPAGAPSGDSQRAATDAAAVESLTLKGVDVPESVPEWDPASANDLSEGGALQGRGGHAPAMDSGCRTRVALESQSPAAQRAPS